uniref:Uncharacterized protein n=1 Tax=Picea glauca TaxID=3330 RepID=A0A101LVY6_PICGL|nr:hypothetical protein ABT39_MTgene1841 [Picea glauca]
MSCLIYWLPILVGTSSIELTSPSPHFPISPCLLEERQSPWASILFGGRPVSPLPPVPSIVLSL